MLIHLIAAARPNFMKIAPLYHALQRVSWAQAEIVHTGQHYDANMSDSFFEDLGLPEPGVNLGVGSGSHAYQTANVMIAYENLCLEKRPDLVVVVGDVNSTMACSLVTSKLGIVTGHLEAGLRSGDRSMPEEINRIVTDTLCDALWTPSRDGDQNLIREGIDPKKIEFVGNVMIDALELLRDKIESDGHVQKLKLDGRKYAVVTLHRPSNVDNRDNLAALCDVLVKVGKECKLVFPVHPRTRLSLEKFKLLGILEDSDGVILSEPLSYIKFMNLVMSASMAITDSGGIQEETSYLGIPCLTLRKNTERPITVTEGTNKLSTLGGLLGDVREILGDSSRRVPKIEFWDGKTAERVVESIANRFGHV